MLGSNILEVAMGLIFVFILISTICTAIREGIEAKLKTRAAYLEQGIRQLLNDPAGTGLAADIYKHPLIYGLFNSGYTPGKDVGSPNVIAKGGNLPSYIPAKSFAAALMDIAANGPHEHDAETIPGAPLVSLKTMRDNVATIANPYVQRVMLNAIDTAQGDMNKVQANLEDWFNSGMDRVSGWYKRSTQWIILVVALIVTVLLNINTITITNYLTNNDTARKIIVAKATMVANDTSAGKGGLVKVTPKPDTTKKDSTEKPAVKNADTGITTNVASVAKTDIDQLNLPVGWPNGIKSMKIDANKHGFWNNILGPLLGWILTALAASLGAPFWFDMLNKVMVIRSTVKPNEKSGEESSKDGSPQVIYVTPPPAAGAGNTPPAA